MRIFLTFVLFLFCLVAKAQVWQWSVEVDSIISNETNEHPRAFLWIPSNCNQVRGVVVGQHNMLEEGILEHPAFRKALADIGFAEVWITPGLDLIFNFNKGAGDRFNAMMKKLGAVSGYTELAYAPVVPIGHSAAASYPWNFAAWNPGRTLAILSVHGDAPLTNLTGSGQPNPDWGNRTIDGIPGLMVEGEYEWWLERVKPALTYRKQHPQSPLSFLADAGRGHFDYSDKLIDYVNMFIRKAVQYRLPASVPLDQPPVLKAINPEKGWLADRWRPDSLPQTMAAPYNNYKGNTAEAFWYFDKEMADATEKYYAAVRGKKEQYIGLLQKGTLLPFQPKQHARVIPAFQPLADGVTFHVVAAFTDTMRTRIIPDHAKAKITISRICGPVIKINDTTFSVRFYRMGFNNPKRTGDIWLLAENVGDDEYKSTVQQANIHISISNNEGKEQQIHFPDITDQQMPLKPVPLNATANAGLPVYYYVMEGPAEIRNNILTFTLIPPRSKYPVKVTVVAWQYGRSIEPKVKSAIPVFKTFYIIK